MDNTESSINEKLIDGSILRKLQHPSYFFISTSFILYSNFILFYFYKINILNISYKWGNEIPIGKIFCLIATFSFLTSLILPFFYWIFNQIFWNLGIDWTKMGSQNEFFYKNLDKFVFICSLKQYAIKNNNSIAMKLVNSEEQNNLNVYRFKIQIFSVAAFIILDLLNTGGILHIILENKPWYLFPALPIILVLVLAWFSFTLGSDDSLSIYLPKLKNEIENL